MGEPFVPEFEKVSDFEMWTLLEPISIKFSKAGSQSRLPRCFIFDTSNKINISLTMFRER